MQKGHITILLLLIYSLTQAQFYETGNEPWHVRWDVIKTDHFKIIYPRKNAQDGQYVANMMERLYFPMSKTLDYQPKRVPIIMHPYTSFSNGYVSWAPRRSEWYMTPQQSGYAQRWLDQLAIHEFRHVVQTNRLNYGFTKVLGWFLGEQAVGLVSAVVPKWFFEGDAVASETAMTNAGRGRMPSFSMSLRSLALGSGYQGFDPAFLGSYKMHVPDHYELGYHLVAWTREQYGSNLYVAAMKKASQVPFLLMPFNLAFKKQTGFSRKQLYYQMSEDLQKRWAEQDSLLQPDTYASLSPKHKFYTSYRYPTYTTSGFIAYKTALDKIPAIVLVDSTGKEETLHKPGSVMTERIGYAANKIVWDEYQASIRYANKSYSVIKLKDLNTGKVTRFGRKGRYYAPNLSPDGKKIVAVEVLGPGRNTIVIWDVATKNIQQTYPMDGADVISFPSFSDEGIVYIRTGKDASDDKKYIALLDSTGIERILFAGDYQTLEAPRLENGMLYFGAHYEGVNNLYVKNLNTGTVSRITNSRFGMFDASIGSDGNIYASEYDENGYKIVKVSDVAHMPRYEIGQNTFVRLYDSIARQENFNYQDSTFQNIEYKSKRFHKFPNVFHVHSWAPMYYKVDVSDIASTRFSPGFNILSQDLLGNLTSAIGYEYKDGSNYLHASFAYKALFPIFEFNFTMGGTQYLSLDLLRPKFIYELRTYVPLNLTRNRFITHLTPQVSIIHEDIPYEYPDIFHNDIYSTNLSYKLSFSSYERLGHRDFEPRWGISLQAGQKRSIRYSDIFSTIQYATAQLWFPGVQPHHSLRIGGAYQTQNENVYLANSVIRFPRGYERGISTDLRMLTLDYALPLCYPDWSLGTFVYLKRLRTNLFYDRAWNKYPETAPYMPTNRPILSSVGLDLLADINILRLMFPLSIGVRTSYPIELKKSPRFELLLNISLN